MRQIIITDVNGETTTGYLAHTPDLRNVFQFEYLKVDLTDRKVYFNPANLISVTIVDAS